MKKVLLSAIAFVAMASTMSAGEIKKGEPVKKPQVNTEMEAADDIVGRCEGTFWLTDPKTHQTIATVHRNIDTDTEADCFKFMTSLYLSMSDLNPQYDIISQATWAN